MLGLGWLAYFSFGMVNSSLPPLGSLIRSDLNLTHTQFGIIVGAWPLTYIVVSYFMGMLIDRFGIRICITSGVLLLSLSAFLRSFAWNFQTMFLAMSVFGLGGPAISIGLPKLVAVWFSGEERGSAVGIYLTGSRMGNIFSLTLTNSIFLPLAGSWKNSFRIYAFAAAFVAVLWYVIGRNAPTRVENDQINRNQSTTKLLGEVIKSKNVWLVVIIGFSFFLSRHGLRNWLPQILELQGMTPANAGWVTSIPAFLGMWGGLSVPRIAARMRTKKPIFFIGLSIMGICIYLIGTSVGMILFLVLVAYGFISGALMPILMLILMDMHDVGEKRMGAAGGLYFTIGEIGGFSGPFIIGFLKDYTGSFFHGVLFLSIFTLAMLIPTLILDERRALVS